MAYNKVVLNENGVERTLLDLTGSTVTPGKLALGETAVNALGETITGTSIENDSGEIQGSGGKLYWQIRNDVVNLYTDENGIDGRYAVNLPEKLYPALSLAVPVVARDSDGNEYANATYLTVNKSYPSILNFTGWNANVRFNICYLREA